MLRAYGEELDGTKKKLDSVWASAKKGSGVLADFGGMLLNAGMALAASVAIDLAVKGIDKLITTYDEHREKLSEAKAEYNDVTGELESVNSELEMTKFRMAELEQDGITIIESDEYQKLVKTNNELERTKRLLTAEGKTTKANVAAEFLATMDSYSHKGASVGKISGGGIWGKKTAEEPIVGAKEALERNLDNFTILTDKKEKAEKDYLLAQESGNAREIKSTKKKYDKAYDLWDEYRENISGELKTLKENAEGVEYFEGTDLTESQKKSNAYLDWIKQMREKTSLATLGDRDYADIAFGALRDLSDAGAESAEAFEKEAESIAKVFNVDGLDTSNGIDQFLQSIVDKANEGSSSAINLAEALKSIGFLAPEDQDEGTGWRVPQLLPGEAEKGAAWNYAEVSASVTALTTQITDLDAALKQQTEDGYLSAESMNKLGAKYLEAMEYEGGQFRLDADEARNIVLSDSQETYTDALTGSILAQTELSNAIREYNSLPIGDRTDAQKENIDALRMQIAQYELLINQINALNSAYGQWKQAQSTANGDAVANNYTPPIVAARYTECEILRQGCERGIFCV